MNRSDKVWVLFMRIGAFCGCHQMPERSFCFRNYQYPLCARCTGVLLGQVLMLSLWHPIGLIYSILGLSILLGDWLLQRFKLFISNNNLRLTTGILAGYSMISLYFCAFTYIFRKYQ
jgi:uncharacterized membrane protein